MSTNPIIDGVNRLGAQAEFYAKTIASSRDALGEYRVETLRLVTQMHGRMAIVCTNPTVLRLFQITSLDDTFDIFDDRAKAIAHVLQDAPGASSADESPAGAP